MWKKVVDEQNFTVTSINTNSETMLKCLKFTKKLRTYITLNGCNFITTVNYHMILSKFQTYFPIIGWNFIKIVDNCWVITTM